MTLGAAADYCDFDFSGVAFGGVLDGYQWVPISDEYNGWVQIGEGEDGVSHCLTYSELNPEEAGPSWGLDNIKQENEANMILCNPQPMEMFEWNVELLNGYPIVEFNTAEATIDIEFEYEFSGTPVKQGNSKKLVTKVLMPNCFDEAEVAPESIQVTPKPIDYVNKTYGFNLDIVQLTIAESSYWFPGPDNTANIRFCVLVEYENAFESVSFYATESDIYVDLKNGIEVLAATTNRVDAIQVDEDADLSYDVVAYFCNAANEPTSSSPVFTQGDVLQVCVEIADDEPEDVYVLDLLEFDISQLDDGSAPGASKTNAIENGVVADALTIYDCQLGVCNVMHQLTSKFFDSAPTPGTLQVDGVALLAFGSPEVPEAQLQNETETGNVTDTLSPAGGERRLQYVKIQSRPPNTSQRSRHQRQLQQSPSAENNENASGEFVLQAELLGRRTTQEDDGTDSTGVIIGSIVAGVSLVACLVAAICIRKVHTYIVKKKKSSSNLRRNHLQMPRGVDLAAAMALPTWCEAMNESSPLA